MEVPSFRGALDNPTFQLGPFACFCACNPPSGSAGGKRLGQGGDNGEEVFVLHTPPRSPERRLGKGLVTFGPATVLPSTGEATAQGSRGGPRQKAEGGTPCSDTSTTVGSPQDYLGGELHGQANVPPLGPVGSGGWHFESNVTKEMRLVRDQAIELYRKREQKELTELNLRFLTSVTLANYVNPIAPQHLVNAFIGRARNEDKLSGRKPVYLCCSLRVIGWDGDGASVMASEPSTMRKSLYYAMPQVEYVGWTAFDLNKPGANGFTLIQDFGGGFSAMHFLNPKPVMDLAQLVEGQWRRRLKVALMVGMPASFQGILNTFLMFVKGNTKDKIRIVATPEDAIKELEKMGCDADTIENARAYMQMRREKERKQRWHPLVDTQFFRERMADMNLSEDTEFLTEDVHHRLRKVIQEFRIHRWGVPKPAVVPIEDGTRAGALGRRPTGERRISRTRSAEQGGRRDVDVLVPALPGTVDSKRSISRLAYGSEADGGAGVDGEAAQWQLAPRPPPGALALANGRATLLQKLGGCLQDICCGGSSGRPAPAQL